MPFSLKCRASLAVWVVFPAALDAGHHDHGGVRAGQLERLVLTAERLGELVADDLDNLLRRRQGLHDLVAERPRSNPIEERVHDLDGRVGLEQRRPDVAERGVDLLGMQLPPRPQLGEDDV